MPRTRTFIAVPLSQGIRDRLLSWRVQWGRQAQDVKWVEPDNLHVTLIFLGEVDNREVPQVCSLTEEAVALAELSAFSMKVKGVGCFPNVRRPRIIWAGVEQGAEELIRVHDALEATLETLGYRREERRFTPHITLGRTRSDGPLTQLGQWLTESAAAEAGEMTVQEIHVMGSELTRSGPQYTVLGRVPLA